MFLELVKFSDEAFETVSEVINESIKYEEERGRKGKISINPGLLLGMSKAIIERREGYITLCIRFAKYLTGKNVPISVIKEIIRNKVWLNFDKGEWYASEEKIKGF